VENPPRPLPTVAANEKSAVRPGKAAHAPTPTYYRVVKWLSTTPALAVCTLCSREFKVPTSALRRTANALASLQEQFGRHKCRPLDSSHIGAQAPADVLHRQEPDADEEEDEEEDDRKEEDDEDDDGSSE